MLALALAVVAPARAAIPIPEGPDASTLPQFVGAPAKPRSIKGTTVPQNPFMAPNGRSNLHDDAYMTDSYEQSGPLGHATTRTSTFLGRECASTAFDAQGRLVTVCVGLDGPQLQLIDPHTLDTLAVFTLPPRIPSGGNPFTDFSGGGYFYLDNQDRAVIPTTTGHIWVVRESGNGFALDRDYDVTSAVPLGDKIESALPDWAGRIWFVSAKGVVGYVDPASGTVKATDTNESIGNSFATDETGGVYVVTDAALYRFVVGPDGAPTASWRSTYPNDGTSKPGQTEVGSGTTPTITGAYVAITDNADPIDIVVYRRADGGQVCTAPVFQKGQSDTDQSLIAAGDSLIAENNYGYSGPAATENGGSTTPGLERWTWLPAAATGSGTATSARPRSYRRSRSPPGSCTRTRRRPARTARTPGTSPRLTSTAAAPTSSAWRARAPASTTTMPPSRSDRTGPPTSACSAGSSLCAMAKSLHQGGFPPS